MSTVNFSITLKKQSVPANPAASANVRYQLMQGATVKDTKTVGLPTVSGSFLNVADGDYTIVAQRMSMLNQPIGDSITSAPFTVVNMTEIDVPDAMNVAV